MMNYRNFQGFLFNDKGPKDKNKGQKKGELSIVHVGRGSNMKS